MITKLIHFDVDRALQPYLPTGEIFTTTLNDTTVSDLKNPAETEIISFKSQSQITANVISKFPNLKLLIARTVGVDNIDIETCKKRNIALYHISDYGNYNVAEHALALLLSGARNIVPANQEVHNGKFSYVNFLGVGIHGKTVGVLGTGRIGVAFIKLLQGFDVEILAYDTFKNDAAQKQYGFTYVTLPELLSKSDIVSIHVPLLPETKHLLGEEEILQMKNGAIFVNAARGAIIDTTALIKHIGKFHAVCLDVLEGEQTLDSNHPILKFSNVVMTPHIGFYTDDSVKRIGEQTLQIIENFSKNISIDRIV